MFVFNDFLIMNEMFNCFLNVNNS